MLVEISDSAELLLDARATRRLVALELNDIDVLPAPRGPRGHAPLFFRVVQMGRDLRVELWQRGDYHGARLVSGTNAAGQLGARRVALAAAELARRLQRKRQAQATRERARATALAASAELRARRTLDGPFALRSSLESAQIGGWSGLLAGPRLAAQWNVPPRARIDAGLTLLGATATASRPAQWLEWSLAAMRRFPLGERSDLDLGVTGAAAWVRLSQVRAVDAIIDQNETWSARTGVVARFEPRLSRRIRLSVGAEAGLVLRPVSFETTDGARERLRGAWLGLGVGIVFTPE